MSDPDANVATNAMSLLIQGDDIATVPLLDAPELPGPYDRVALLRTVVDSELEIRKRTVERLEKMLGDKTAILPNAGDCRGKAAREPGV